MVVFVSSWKINLIRHEITLLNQWNPEKAHLLFFLSILLFFVEKVCALLSLGPSLPSTLGCLYWRITLKAAEQVQSSNTRWSHSCRSTSVLSMVRVRTQSKIFLTIFRIINLWKGQSHPRVNLPALQKARLWNWSGRGPQPRPFCSFSCF